MSKDRFEFGENWNLFLKDLTSERINKAENSLMEWLNMESLEGKKFLDVDAGSGLFSLAAKNLGAEVFSFDYDAECVECVKYLKWKYYDNDKKWKIGQGDILDRVYLSQFDEYDIVYSWGVLHHTGKMYQAFDNIQYLVKENGILFISIYNDQGRKSRKWKKSKKGYNNCPKIFRFLIIIPCFIELWFPIFIYDFWRLKPFYTWRNHASDRGMSPWRDVIDWIGGYPFEVAKPEEVFDFFHDRGFGLEKMYTAGKGYGCNQFVFRKNRGVSYDNNR